MSAARAPLCLLACSDASELAAGVAKHLGCTVAGGSDVWFASGEAKYVDDLPAPAGEGRGGML